MKYFSLKNWKRLLNRRVLTLAAVGILLGGAVVVNIVMNGAESEKGENTGKTGAEQVASVSALSTGGSFFEAYREERDMVRTEELAYLDAIVAQGADEETLSDAQQQKLSLIACMEAELNSENLIKAKGFEDVIVSMHNGAVNVIVGGETLSDEQVAQILDIVLRATGETARNVKVSLAQ